MKSLSFETLKSLLKSPKNVVIVPHINPDGDAIGSSLGLYHYLIQKGHSATIVVPNDYPAFLKWLPGTTEVLNFEFDSAVVQNIFDNADLVFTGKHHFEGINLMEQLLESEGIVVKNNQIQNFKTIFWDPSKEL